MSKTILITVRLDPHQHALLTRAAAVLYKDRSAFILDVACREAENLILDQRLFQLDAKTYEEFDAALAEPVSDNPRLRALLRESPPWES